MRSGGAVLQKISNVFKDFALLPVRLSLGSIFIAHGGQILFGLWGGKGLREFAGSLAGLGLNPPILWAILAGGGQFFGALMVLFGFYARLGALLISTIMVVAIITVHGPHGFFLENHGYEYNVALLGLSLCILFAGPGRMSMKGN